MLRDRAGSGIERGHIAGAGDLPLFQILHPLGDELRGPFVEYDSVHHPALDSKHEQDQPGHEELVAVEFHCSKLAN